MTQARKLLTEKGCVDEQSLRAVQSDGEEHQCGCKVSFASCGAQASSQHTKISYGVDGQTSASPDPHILLSPVAL